MAAPDPYIATDPVVSQLFQEGYMSGETLLNYPDIFSRIFPFLQEEKTIVDFMITAGRKKRTVQSDYTWHEEDSLIPMAKIKAVAGTPGAGNQITVTMYALNAAKEVPFKKWDILQVGSINGWIEKAADITVSSGDGFHQFKITPVHSGADIVTAGVVDEYVVWLGSAKADGSGQPGSMMSKPLPYSGQTQIIATNYTTHGSAAANKAWVTTRSGNELFYYRGVEQAVVRHKLAIVYTLLLGQESLGLADTAHEDGSQTVRTTSGLDETMRANGNPKANTAFDFNELQFVLNKKLDELFASDEFFALCGNEQKYNIDNILFDRNFNNNPATYGAFATDNWLVGGSPEERAVSYKFASARLGDRTFHFRQERSLYYPQITGAPNKTFPNTMYLLPADQFRDAKSGDYMDSMCLRYKQSDLEDRFTKEWTRDYKSDDIDKFRFNHMSELGWMQARVRQTAIWEKS